MDVTLDPETERLVQEEIQSGRFRDATALIGTALKHFLIAREFGEEYTRPEIEKKVGRGIGQLEQGNGLDGDEFFLVLRRRRGQIR